MYNVGPALVLSAIGLILWLAVDARLAGVSIQTIGVILFLVGVVWLVISLFQDRLWAREREVVRDPAAPAVREREIRY
jgi:hypothetical protein